MDMSERIARELASIAREIAGMDAPRARKAGGGAGIDFKIVRTGTACEYVARADYANGTFTNFTVEEKDGGDRMTIERFDANGYDDGMNGVDGRKVFSSVDVDITPIHDEVAEDLDYAEKNWDEEDLEQLAEILSSPDGLKFWVEAADGQASSSVMFAGWIRGRLEEGDTVDFINDVSITFDDDIMSEFNGDVQDVGIYGTLNATGESWYNDVFVNSVYDEDDPYMLSDMYGNNDDE